jgi:hypothetical protein
VKTILATFLTVLLLLPVSAIGEIQTVTHCQTVFRHQRGCFIRTFKVRIWLQLREKSCL